MPEPRQNDLFRKPTPGEELRDRALRRFESNEGPWLQRARTVLVELLQDGRDLVSSDDVWLFCPPPADAHPSVMGAIFKHPAFVTVGWKASSRPSAHARVIRTYRLKE